MGFLSSLRGLKKHEPVVSTSPTKSPKPDTSKTSSQTSINSQTRITTQRPAPSTPSPRAHA